MGLPEFSCTSLPACHGLRTPADLHILAKTDASVLPFQPSAGLKPSASAIAISKRYHHFRDRGLPYGLQDALPTPNPSCSLPGKLLATPPWVQGSIRVGG